METIELARKVVEAASNRQAGDIVLFDMREACSFADYFVICSGESERQIEAIQREIHEVLKRDGISPLHREGEGSGWVLVDVGDIIVHIFAPQERDYYQLDKLWDKAVPLLRIL